MPLDSSIITNTNIIISKIVLAIYINNLLIAKKDKANILYIKELLKARFKVKNLDNVQIILNIKMR